MLLHRGSTRTITWSTVSGTMSFPLFLFPSQRRETLSQDRGIGNCQRVGAAAERSQARPQMLLEGFSRDTGVRLLGAVLGLKSSPVGDFAPSLLTSYSPLFAQADFAPPACRRSHPPRLSSPPTSDPVAPCAHTAEFDASEFSRWRMWPCMVLPKLQWCGVRRS